MPSPWRCVLLNSRPMSNDDTQNTQNSWANLFETIRKTVFLPINSAGWPFIFAFAFATIILALIWDVLGVIGLVLTLWCLYFFRDPHRIVPAREGLVISSASGKVVAVKHGVTLPHELDKALDDSESFTCISVFLSVFDVHVNRVPMAGRVIQTAYRPGKFLNAALDKASSDNEMSATLLRVEDGKKEYDVAFVQIAGWVARRIINNLTPDQIVQTGERMGLIRFGSRVDVYVPSHAVPMVVVGQTVIEGESVLADLKSKEKPRTGVVI